MLLRCGSAKAPLVAVLAAPEAPQSASHAHCPASSRRYTASVIFATVAQECRSFANLRMSDRFDSRSRHTALQKYA